MILFPNAKINLGLNITERRADGYHNLESLFLPVNWHDILEIIPSEGTETLLTVYGKQPDCSPEDNLVIRAYRKIKEIKDIPAVDIYLEKIIPEGAGLGGGSSDAAFMLKGLNELFNLNFSQKDLAEIASTLGADCTFFIYNKPMIATGIGTTLTEYDFDTKGLYIVIVKPDILVSTKKAYSGVHPLAWETHLTTLLKENRFEEIQNDFEYSIFLLYPELASIKNDLYRNGAIYASMSGSGSAIYGLFDNQDSAKTAATMMNKYPYVYIGKL